MNDMSLAPFAEANADRITGDDLIGGPRTITITRVEGAVEEGKKRAIIHFDGEEPGKPFKPCKTMVRVMMAIWGEYASAFVGKSLTLFRDPAVTFGGLATGGVRISHMSHMAKPMTVVVAAKKGKKGPITIEPLQISGQATEDPAAKWTTAFLAKVRACNDLDALSALEIAQAKRLAELREKRPELSAQCEDMIAEQRTFLTPESPADDDMGDGFADEFGED